MAIVRLGKIQLRWCRTCNVPVLEASECGSCGKATAEVALTPPGDARPAFRKDMELVRKTVSEQFGEMSGQAMVPDDRVVLLNRCPSIDRFDEVIVDGHVLGSLEYQLTGKYRFIPRLEGARRVEKLLEKNWIVVDEGAVTPIIGGMNAMSPGIIEFDHQIRDGDDVIVLDPDRRVIGVGIAKMDASGFGKCRGVGVKVRWASEPGEAEVLHGGVSWSDVIKANEPVLNRKAELAARFIKRTAAKHGLPVAVSFSGGKDSLATLLLLLESGLRPRLMFVDTGLELDETIRHVNEVARKHGLELLQCSASDEFWTRLSVFGPPGRDFRWCCKVCKLGPATKLIEDNFPDGVLSFIGQRRYESEQRSNRGNVWNNPWVPNQVGASPIQDWTALHVWLYIFRKGESYNRYYEEGLERIGCFLCPASSLDELAIIEKTYPGYERWKDYLQRYAESNGFSEGWLRMHMWRWKKLPRPMLEFAEKNGIKFNLESVQRAGRLSLDVLPGYQPCSVGVSAEGVFNQKLEIERACNLMHCIGEPKEEQESNSCTVDGITVFGEGSLIVKGADISEVRKKVWTIEKIVRRAVECVGCGICATRCQHDALEMGRDRKVWIKTSNCVHCGRCLEICPVLSYSAREEHVADTGLV